MKTQSAFRLFIVLLSGCAGLLFAAPPEPLLYYNFNEGTSSFISKGTETEKMVAKGKKQKAGAPGSGVSGKENDRAWDASENTTCGPAAPLNESNVRSATDIPALDELTQFTMTFWFTSEQFMGDAVRLVYKCDHMNQQKKGFVIRSYTTDYLNGKLALWLRIGDGSKTYTFVSKYYEAGQGFNAYGIKTKWLFAAVTWDGEHVRFYYGDRETPVEVSGFVTRFQGKIAAHKGPLILGNGDPSIRGLDGKMDNFRFYKNALGIDELESIRQSDVRGE